MNGTAPRAASFRLPFGDMAICVNDRVDNPREAGVERYVGLEHLDSDSLRIQRWGSPADVDATKLLFRKGDIIFGRRRAYQRKLAVADFDGICSAHAMVLRARPEVVLPGFLPFFMQSDIFMTRALAISVGSLSPTINWKSLAQEEFILPPLAEQRALVSTLSAAQQCIDAHAVLAQKARELFEATGKALLVPHDTQLGNAGVLIAAPLNWRALTIRELCSADSDLTIGPFGSNLVRADYAGRKDGVPVIFVRDIRPNEFHYVSACFISNAKAKELDAHTALPGDVVVTKMGVPESMGIPPGLTAVVPEDFPPSVVTADVVRVRVDERTIMPSYLAYLLNCAWGRRQVWRLSPGSTTRFKMTLGNFARIQLPVPPLSRQREVVRTLDVIRRAIPRAMARRAAAQEIVRTVLAPLKDPT